MQNEAGATEVNSWNELAVRLQQYGEAVSALGGMNDLDKALYMAVQGIEELIKLQSI